MIKKDKFHRNNYRHDYTLFKSVGYMKCYLKRLSEIMILVYTLNTLVNFNS